MTWPACYLFGRSLRVSLVYTNRSETRIMAHTCLTLVSRVMETAWLYVGPLLPYLSWILLFNLRRGSSCAPYSLLRVNNKLGRAEGVREMRSFLPPPRFSPPSPKAHQHWTHRPSPPTRRNYPHRSPPMAGLLCFLGQPSVLGK